MEQLPAWGAPAAEHDGCQKPVRLRRRPGAAVDSGSMRRASTRPASLIGTGAGAGGVPHDGGCWRHGIGGAAALALAGEAKALVQVVSPPAAAGKLLNAFCKHGPNGCFLGNSLAALTPHLSSLAHCWQ